MTARTTTIVVLCLAALVPCAWSQEPAAVQPPTGPDRVAAMKQSLQAGLAAVRQYEWIETTVMSLKGEAKSTTQNRCYYGADGKVEKVPVAAPAAEGKSPRGLRGKIVANKKEEISDSVKEAVALVKDYVPPDPAKIQAAKDAGRITMNPPDAQGHAAVVIKDYLKTGDSLTVEMDAASNRLLGLVVSTYTEKAKDAVGLNVSLGTLPDGAVFPAKIVLDVEKESVSVAIENSGHRKVGS